jgi:hypothetical protein
MKSEGAEAVCTGMRDSGCAKTIVQGRLVRRIRLEMRDGRAARRYEINKEHEVDGRWIGSEAARGTRALYSFNTTYLV